MTKQVGKTSQPWVPDIGAQLRREGKTHSDPPANSAVSLPSPSLAAESEQKATGGMPAHTAVIGSTRNAIPNASRRPKGLVFESQSKASAVDAGGVSSQAPTEPEASFDALNPGWTRSPMVPSRTSASPSKFGKLVALAATLSAMPQVSHSFVRPAVRMHFSARSDGLSFNRRSVEYATAEPPHAESVRAGRTSLADTQAGGADHHESDDLHFDDFGDQPVGGIADSDVGNPENFLAKFKKQGEANFSEDALKAYGYTKDIDLRLTELENVGQQTIVYWRKLDTLAATCLQFVKSLSEISRSNDSLAILNEVNDCYLVDIDRLYLSAGNEHGRLNFLRKIHHIYSQNNELQTPDGAMGKLFCRLSEKLQQEVRSSGFSRNMTNQALIGGGSKRSTVMLILEHHQGMLERQAELESRLGNHDRATALLRQCESMVSDRMILNPDAALSESVGLCFAILKSQILAGDEEAVGTLETLYMLMLSYADRHPDRFSTSFPRATFVNALEGAYSVFLRELESDELRVTLDHPIVQLYADAKAHGVIDR